MLRIIILGMVVITVVLLFWVARGELEARRVARERDRHDRIGD